MQLEGLGEGETESKGSTGLQSLVQVVPNAQEVKQQQDA